MAKFNEILVGRYNRYLQKLFGMKGGPPAAQLSSEIQVDFPLFTGRENRYLEGWKTYSIVTTIGPNAAQTEGMQIRNPAGSNVIAVLESMAWVALGANQLFSWSFNFVPTQADLTNLVLPVNHDNRGGGVTGSNIIASLSAGGTTDLAVFIAQYRGAVDVMFEAIQFEDHEIPILPSTTHRFKQTVVNTTTILNLRWRERFLEEPERT